MRAYAARGIHRIGGWALVALCMALTACTASGDGTAGGADGDFAASDARSVTTEEAQTLATMRFRNFDAGTRAVAFELAADGEQVRFEGWFDYAAGTGYGELRNADAAALLLWNDEAVAYRQAADDEQSAPLPVPDTGEADSAWTSGALDAASSRLHSVLQTIAALGVDRPDNPLLLQQTGALWLGERTVDGLRLTVYAGPPSDAVLEAGRTADPDEALVRYWIDDTGLLHRADVRIGGEAGWTTITYADAPGVTIGDPFADAGAGS